MNVEYREGIYVGYRYFDSFNVKPLYEFGYGLSYTTFGYSDIRISDNLFRNEIYVAVDVKNTGNVEGKEAVQLYLSAPKGRRDKPVKELKAFSKTRLLKPGDVQTIYFKLNPKDLASFDQTASAWIADAGIYTISIGASSANIKQSAEFTLGSQRTVELVNNVMNDKVNFMDIKP